MSNATRLVILVAFLFGWVACAPTGAESPMVHVGHNKIEPAEVTVAVGGTVIFHNMDAMPGGHTIEAVDGSFESPPLDKDQKWEHVFAAPGRYAIRIRQHPTATGVVIVK